MQYLRHLGYGAGAPPLMPLARRRAAEVLRQNTRPASLTVNQRRSVKRMINASKELNYTDTNIATGTDVTTTGTITSLVDIAQGDGEGERLNDKIELTSFKTQIHLRANTSPLGTVRYILFRWISDNNVESPVVSSILEGDDMSFIVADQAKRKKFQVLWDKQVTITNDTSSPYHGRIIKKTVRLKNKPIYFNAAATTGRYMLYLLAILNSGTANDIEHEQNIRVFYRDA